MSDEQVAVSAAQRRRPAWPTADQLRADIDSGRTGDKVPVSDPAASPLGTDEEAAGTPLTREDIALAHAQEVGAAQPPAQSGLDRPIGTSSDQGIGRTGGGRNPAEPNPTVGREGGPGVGMVIGLTLALAAVIVIVAVLALR